MWRRHSVVTVLFLMMVGCTSQRYSFPSTGREPINRIPALLTLQAAQQLAPADAKAFLVARAALDEEAVKSGAQTASIMDFKVTRSEKGWKVYVQYVGGWFEGKPIPMAGFFSVVLLNEKWEVVRITPGA